MPVEITTIRTGVVNCYLLKSGENYCLVDTGFAKNRTDVLQALKKNGCQPQNLQLIIVTHSDSDHIGNCHYLQQQYGVQIAMHQAEVKAAESGDAFKNRKFQNGIARMISRLILSFVKLKKSDRFTPDLVVKDGDDLSQFGFEAKIIHLPGHSIGSIGILTTEGDLFCGDLLINNDHVAPGYGIFDQNEFKASIDKLKNSNIQNIYPGHGKPFKMELLLNSERLQ